MDDSDGGVAMLGNHVVKHWSKTQACVALSSGESELYAICKGAAMGIALRALFRDLGIDVEVEVQSDSSTAGSICSRLGVGQRTKHLQTRYLWVQERVAYGDLEVSKISTKVNESDICTKPLPSRTFDRHCRSCGLLFS